MAKTDFEHGTIVTPGFLDKIFKDGHHHDGLDEDGHCSKIDLSTESTGNIGVGRVEGSLPQSQIAGYSFGSFEIDINPFTNIPVHWEKHILPGAESPVLVRLHFPPREMELPVGGILDSSGTAKPTIPAELRPSTDIFCPAMVLNSGTLVQPGAVQIFSTGTVKFYGLCIDSESTRPYMNHNFVIGSVGGWFAFSALYPIIFEE